MSVIEITGTCAHCKAASIVGRRMSRSSRVPAIITTRRPLDALAATAVVVLMCLSWGFNQVATKLAIPDVPPLIQAAVRSVGALPIVARLGRLRGIAMTVRDGTLVAGIVAGLLFGLEFMLIYRGLP